MFMQYLMDLDDLSRFNKIVSLLGYAGKTLFSFLLPRQFWHKTFCGNIDKISLGSSSSSLIKCIFDNYEAQEAALHNLLTNVNSLQIGTCCILDIALVSTIVS